ncbi:PHP domain-containing protein [Candidatus Woesearchaeota archaeon]|nr:PHP domain-containing protein [Candidatus Woesearchaeota archaeon]
MSYIDLQSHTNASDGELNPKETVDLAIKRGLNALAITDHDTVDALGQAISYAKNKSIEIVPGIEIECSEPRHGFKKVHMLGLLIDYNNSSLLNLTKKSKEGRIRQKRKIIKRLNSLGFDITFNEVSSTVKGSFGRPHVAKILLKKYPGEFASIRDVFDRYIGEGRPAYVPRKNMVTLKEAISIVKNANGIPILAHPGVFKKEGSLQLIDIFCDSGGEGIETYYPYHIVCPELKINKEGNDLMIKFYREAAKSKNLLESGGNDFHGSYRDTMGEIKIPYSVLEKLRLRIPVQ